MKNILKNKNRLLYQSSETLLSIYFKSEEFILSKVLWKKRKWFNFETKNALNGRISEKEKIFLYLKSVPWNLSSSRLCATINFKCRTKNILFNFF